MNEAMGQVTVPASDDPRDIPLHLWLQIQTAFLAGDERQVLALANEIHATGFDTGVLDATSGGDAL